MENKVTNQKSGFILGFICGLFLIFGLIGGFLYPVGSTKREEFINGWLNGVLCVVIVSVLLFIIFTTAGTAGVGVTGRIN